MRLRRSPSFVALISLSRLFRFALFSSSLNPGSLLLIPFSSVDLLLVLGFGPGDRDADRTYTGTTPERGHSDLQTGHRRRLGLLPPYRKLLIPRLFRSSWLMPGSSHWNKHGQQYRCPHLVTTGSTTSSKQMLHENRLSPLPVSLAPS